MTPTNDKLREALRLASVLRVAQAHSNDHGEDMIRAAGMLERLAALNAPTESVKAPEGVTQVPVEPTEAMLEAGVEHLFGWADDDPKVDARLIWSAMLAASPTPITADDAVAQERERVGEWRPVESRQQLKGMRRSPKYYPAIGEACRMSGPSCDDADGYTWANVDVLWRDNLFIVTRSNGCWPTVTKLELALFEPAAIRSRSPDTEGEGM